MSAYLTCIAHMSNCLRFRFVLSVLLAVMIPMGTSYATTPHPAQSAGTVTLVEGTAKVMHPDISPQPITVGDTVAEGDQLVTGADGEIHLNMRDGGFIAVRPGTRFQIVAYTADGGSDDRGIFNLLVGGFRSISGWIGKFNRPSYVVRTPSATIGIRGTDHEPHYIPEGSSEGDPGTYDRVYAGESVIETAAGRTSVTPGKSGFASALSHAPPILLPHVPAFFRPGRHEAQINKMHAQIQRQLDRQRDERQRAISGPRQSSEGVHGSRAGNSSISGRNAQLPDIRQRVRPDLRDLDRAQSNAHTDAQQHRLNGTEERSRDSRLNPQFPIKNKEAFKHQQPREDRATHRAQGSHEHTTERHPRAESKAKPD